MGWLCLSGCGPEIACEGTFDCGGDILGTVDTNEDGLSDVIWVVTETCEKLPHTPNQQATLINQPPHLSGEAPPEPSSEDWCANLRFRQDGTLEFLNNWFPRYPLRVHPVLGENEPVWYDAALTLVQRAPDVPATAINKGTFSFAGLQYAEARIELSKYCLTAQGVALSCEALTAAVKEVWAPESAAKQIDCKPATNSDGCACDYKMILNTGPAGYWLNDEKSGRITFFNGQPGAPMEANYCVEGDTLTMNGYERTPLFGQLGVHNLTFKRVDCRDGAQGPGEEGVDCGPHCPSPCPANCTDMDHGPGEDGIDCGPGCPNLCE